MERTPAGCRPVDEEKRCINGECEYGRIGMEQFSPGRECPVCEGTAMRDPYAGKQLAVEKLVEAVSAKDWNQCSREEIEELQETIEEFP